MVKDANRMCVNARYNINDKELTVRVCVTGSDKNATINAEFQCVKCPCEVCWVFRISNMNNITNSEDRKLTGYSKDIGYDLYMLVMEIVDNELYNKGVEINE